jgi:hypothetical protein
MSIQEIGKQVISQAIQLGKRNHANHQQWERNHGKGSVVRLPGGVIRRKRPVKR